MSCPLPRNDGRPECLERETREGSNPLIDEGGERIWGFSEVSGRRVRPCGPFKRSHVTPESVLRSSRQLVYRRRKTGRTFLRVPFLRISLSSDSFTPPSLLVFPFCGY